MTDWTPPTHVVSGASIDSAKHNAETVDNIKHLHEAKLTRLARFEGTTIPNNANYGIAWDFEAHDTMGSWQAVPNPERIYPNPAGFYRVSFSFTFPAAAGGGIGGVALQLWQDSTFKTVTQATGLLSATRSTSRNVSAIVEMDGVGDYLFATVYQDSGSLMNTTAGSPNSFDLEWIGA